MTSFTEQEAKLSLG